MDFQKELTKYGLYYPPDPGSMAVTTMGGNVAENAGWTQSRKIRCDQGLPSRNGSCPTFGSNLADGWKDAQECHGLQSNTTLLWIGRTLGLITENYLEVDSLCPEAKKDAPGRL